MSDRTGIFAGADPFAIASRWLAEAGESEPNDPTAAALATVDPDGLPNVRMVLVKSVGPEGVTFYTNYESAKGRELSQSGKAAMVLHWKSLRRQIRLRGPVEREDGPIADAYYDSRPLADRRLGLETEPSAGLEGRTGEGCRGGRVAPRHRSQASFVLGRFSDRSSRARVLGERGIPTARPIPLDEGYARGRVERSTALSVSAANCGDMTHDLGKNKNRRVWGR